MPEQPRSASAGTSAGTSPAPQPVTATPLPAILLLFSVSTGIIDAVSVLGLGNVFTANMTGNVVFLGFGVAGERGFLLDLLIGALVAFLVGAAAGGRIASWHKGSPVHRWLVRCASVEALLILGAAVVVLVSGDTGAHTTRLVLIVLLALAMGLRNATVRRLGIADMTTTVLTLTLTGLAADSTAAGGTNPNLGRRGGAVSAIFLGAAIGAALLGAFGASLPLALAGLLTIGSVLAVRGHGALQRAA
ncbi:YoaK family protein [Frigidibacter sp. MR17.14]|uniref:YoaK family protein n=1 Tax=Frigidibacter sp. MR17.14 TaxID=3126509 RepID=UPI003012D6FB